MKLAAFSEEAWDSESGVKTAPEGSKCWIAILESSEGDGPELLHHTQGLQTIVCMKQLGPCFGENNIMV